MRKIREEDEDDVVEIKGEYEGEDKDGRINQ